MIKIIISKTQKEPLKLWIYFPSQCFHLLQNTSEVFNKTAYEPPLIGNLIFLARKWKWKVTQSYPTLYNPMDYTVHGILQARILEWVAFPFSRGSSQPRDRTQVFHIAGRFFTNWATREVHLSSKSEHNFTKLKILEHWYWIITYKL